MKLIATLTLSLVVSLTCLVGRPLFAQQAAPNKTEPRKVYQPVGAPADPKVPARWNFFRDYAQSTALLKQLAKAHPRRCQLRSLGKSHGGREMWLLTVGNLDEPGPTGDINDKPAFWIDGGIHANETQSVEVVLYSAWLLLELDGRNDFVTRLLKHEFWLRL